MTLVEWLEMWYNTYVRDSSMAVASQEMYRRSIEAVPAHLGRLDLRELTPVHCFIWLKQRAAETPRAAQLDRIMLQRALRTAAKCRLMDPIILDEDTCPRIEHKAAPALILDADQVGVYIEHALRSPAAPLLLFCLCGLRRGEALGVRWQDVDLASGVLHVRGQRQRIRRQYMYKELKTEKSKRSLQMPGILWELLRRWPRDIRWDNSGTKRGTFVLDLSPEKLQKEHKKVLKSANLPPVTLHGLRHTFATLAAAQGVPMKQLQMALGHSNYKLTADLYADHLSSFSSVQSLVFQRFVG